MAARWSKNQAAINTGYGMRPKAYSPIYPHADIPHTEQLFEGPYGTPPTPSMDPYRFMNYPSIPMQTGSNGGKSSLVKGSTAAKERMRYLRSLRGHGYDSAALRGLGYDSAALRGLGYNSAALAGGSESLISEMASQIGSNAMDSINALATRLGTTVNSLVSDPDKLLALLQQYAPSVVNGVKKFFSWLTLSNPDPQTNFVEYMKWLKQTDPEKYRETYRQMQIEAYNKFIALTSQQP